MKKRGIALLAAVMFLLGGCGLPGRAGVSSAPDQASESIPKEPEKITMAAGGQTVLLLPGQAQTFTVTLPGEMPIILDKDGDSAQVIFENEVVFDGAAIDLKQFVPKANGAYTYTFTRQGESYTCTVNTEFAPQIVWNERAVAQGEMFVLEVRYAGDSEVKGETTLNMDLHFFKQGDSYIALIPAHYNLAAGTYDLSVMIGQTKYTTGIQVSDTEFEVQYLTIDQQTYDSTAGSSDANAEWNRRIEPLKYVYEAEKYWDGDFIKPVEGETTTEFGMIRYTNGVSSGRHGGVDIAADLGTPVLAAGAGKVLFADYLQVSGNTVLIEHGYGLKSWYYHMDSLNVSEGEMVQKGQEIGKVGTTGFSTGPHLHFAMSVGRVYTNPWTILEDGVAW